MEAYRIAGWQRYEPTTGHGSLISPLKYVKFIVHGHQIGASYRKLAMRAGPDLAASFGLFAKLLEIAADEQKICRDGTLRAMGGGPPANSSDLAFLTMFPVDLVERCLGHLVDIGWLDIVDNSDPLMEISRNDAQLLEVSRNDAQLLEASRNCAHKRNEYETKQRVKKKEILPRGVKKKKILPRGLEENNHPLPESDHTASPSLPRVPKNERKGTVQARSGSNGYGETIESRSSSHGHGKPVPGIGDIHPVSGFLAETRPVDSDSSDGKPSSLPHLGMREGTVFRLALIFNLPSPSEGRTRPRSKQQRSDWTTIRRLVYYVVTASDREEARAQASSILDLAKEAADPAAKKDNPVAFFVSQVKARWPNCWSDGGVE